MIKVIYKILILIIFLGVFPKSYLAQKNMFQNKIRLAKSFEARGQIEEAEKIYKQLHNSEPVNYQFYNSLFKNLISQKKYDEALFLAEKQIVISSNKVNLYGDLGSVYFLKGEDKKAIEIWDEALELEPNNSFAYRTIADYLFEYRILDKAVEVLQLGNEVADDKTMFSYEIANLFSLTMKYEEATFEYCKILETKPKQINLVKTKILAYVNNNQATEPTLKTVRKIYEDEEKIVYLQLLAELYLYTNKQDQALNTSIKIEEETSRNGSVVFTFAQQASRLGNFNVASQAYLHLIENYPSSALFSESEISYARSLEAELNNKAQNETSWKPVVIPDSKYDEQYKKLISAYKKLSEKYEKNKIGWEAEYRMARIYFDNLLDLDKSNSIFNNIINEVKSFQFIEEAKYGLAQIAIKNGDLEKADSYLSSILNNRMAKPELKTKTNFLLAKTKLWNGLFSESIEHLNKVKANSKDKNVNDALQYLLLVNTFKNDSTNLFSFFNADYLVRKNNYVAAAAEFKKLAQSENLFLLKDFAALHYAELQLALNNYQEAVIFLEEVSNCDKDNIYKDRFLYLLGSNYYYGLKNGTKALVALTQIFDEFPNSIYFNKARKIISEINEGVKETI